MFTDENGNLYFRKLCYFYSATCVYLYMSNHMKQGKLKPRRNKKMLPKLQLPLISTNIVEEDNDNVLHMVELDDLWLNG